VQLTPLARPEPGRDLPAKPGRLFAEARSFHQSSDGGSAFAGGWLLPPLVSLPTPASGAANAYSFGRTFPSLKSSCFAPLIEYNIS